MNLRQRFVSGVAWRAGSRVARQVAAIVVGIVLARLIGPKEFGVVTMATVVIGFATLFDDLGMEAALVRVRNSDDVQRSSVLWFSLGLGIALALVTAVSGVALSRFYHEPALVSLMAVLSLRFPVAALAVVHRAELERALDFKALGRINFLAITVGGTAGIAVAWFGGGAWALVVQELGVTAASVLQLWAAEPWRPRAVFRRDSLKGLLNFGLYLMAVEVNAYVSRNLDNVLIGRFYGKTSLALYNRAYSFIYIPLFLAQTVSTVLFPTLAKLGNDLVRIRRTFLRVSGVVALLSWPPIVGLVVTADPFVRVVFGPGWLAMIPLIRILSPVAIWQSIGMLHILLFQATGRTGILFRVNFLSNLFSVAGICLGIHWGPRGVATGYLIGSAIAVAINLGAALAQVEASYRELFRVLWKIGIACAVMAGTVAGTLVPLEGSPAWIRLLAGTAVGIAAYAGAVSLLRPDAFHDLRQAANSLRGGAET